MRLNENIDHVTILVDGPPQILSLTLDRHEQFVQVPGVAQTSLPSPERPGVFDTKLPTPLSDGFVADGDAPLCQRIFHISEAQAKSVVEPNSVADDIRWKSIAAISGQVGFHLGSLLGSSQLDNTAEPCRIVRLSRSTNEVFSFAESSEFRNACSNLPAPITTRRSTLTTRSFLRVLIT
jgi:hypothetical protein